MLNSWIQMCAPRLRHLIERAVVQSNQLFSLQRSQSIGAPMIVTEFDLDHRWSEELNDGSHLPANKPLLGHILEYGYFGEKFHCIHAFIALKEYSK